MVETTSNKILYQVGESRVFPFPIRFIAPSDVHCFINVNGTERELRPETEFTVEYKEDYSYGANLTLNLDPLPTGATLAIVRQCDPVQLVSFPINGKFPSKSNENALDKLTMLVQDLVEKVSRCIKSVVTQTAFSFDELLSMISNSVALAAAAADEAKNAAHQADKVLLDVSSSVAEAASAAEQAASAAADYANAAGTAAGEAASAASTAVNDALKNTDFVVESYESEDRWFRKYRSGWVEQGGVATRLENPQIINLPVEMATDKYTCVFNNNMTNEAGYVSNMTTTSVSITTSSWRTGDLTYWYVCGMSATE